MPHNLQTSMIGGQKSPSPLLKKPNDQVDASSRKSSVSSSSHDDALLLASFADIASKVDTKLKHDESTASPISPNNVSCAFPIQNTITSVLPSNSSTGICTQPQSPALSRPRTISYSPNEVYGSNLLLMPFVDQLDASPASKTQIVATPLRKAPCRTILRKKFSWKHYPPLEDFLIANRDEYLRHSTLNYTLQQKKYNNMLTEQMIQLASQHRLVFDKKEFSFVTVRDRIRCYYKSYVQSLKKRGIVCGYAARRAGLISKEEMNKNAATKARIFVPN